MKVNMKKGNPWYVLHKYKENMVYIWKKKKLLLFNRIKQQQDIDCNNFLQKRLQT